MLAPMQDFDTARGGAGAPDVHLVRGIHKHTCVAALAADRLQRVGETLLLLARREWHQRWTHGCNGGKEGEVRGA